jgi:hypothetical protein
MTSEEENNDKQKNNKEEAVGGKEKVAQPVEEGVAVSNPGLAKSLVRKVVAPNRKKKGLLQPKKCGKCEGCKGPLCGYCPVCVDNPRFGGHWAKYRKRGCIGTPFSWGLSLFIVSC